MLQWKENFFFPTMCANNNMCRKLGKVVLRSEWLRFCAEPSLWWRTPFVHFTKRSLADDMEGRLVKHSSTDRRGWVRPNTFQHIIKCVNAAPRIKCCTRCFTNCFSPGSPLWFVSVQESSSPQTVFPDGDSSESSAQSGDAASTQGRNLSDPFLRPDADMKRTILG